MPCARSHERRSRIVERGLRAAPPGAIVGRGLRAAPVAQRGVVSVEMALVAPVLIVLLFGIIEFGLAIKDYLGINQAAREAARTAVVGGTLGAIDSRLDSSAPTIDTSNLSRTYEYRDFSESTGTWSDWLPLANVGSGSDTQNNAPEGAQVRVSVSYPHPLLTGPLFSRLADDPDTGAIILTAAMVMRRE